MRLLLKFRNLSLFSGLFASTCIPSALLVSLLSLFLFHCTPTNNEPDYTPLALLLLSNLNQDDVETIQDLSAYLADTVTDAPTENASHKPAGCTQDALSGFKDTSKITNGVLGGGESSGSTDVYSLRGWSTHLTLEWSGRRVTDGTGIDFIVFENAINNPSGGNFIEPAFIEVSRDGVNFCGFNPDYTAADETVHSTDPAHWRGFAGRSPVLLNQEDNHVEIANMFTDANGDGMPDLAGGDGFDLQDLSTDNTFSTGCDATERDAIIAQGFVYLRIIDSNTRNNPDTGAPYAWSSGSFDCASDYDGIIARNLTAR